MMIRGRRPPHVMAASRRRYSAADSRRRSTTAKLDDQDDQDEDDEEEKAHDMVIGDECLPAEFKMTEPRVLLGKGVFGRVFLVEDAHETKSGRSYAAKWVKVRNKWERAGTLREIDFLRELERIQPSPRIAPKLLAWRECHKGDEKRNSITMVLERFDSDGKKLFRRVGGRVVIDEAHLLQMFKIALILDELGIVHGDLKPDQYLYNQRLDRLVLADFGFAGVRTPAKFAKHRASPALRKYLPSTGWSYWTVCDAKRGTGEIKQNTAVGRLMPRYNLAQLENYILQFMGHKKHDGRPVYVRRASDGYHFIFAGVSDSLFGADMRRRYVDACPVYAKFERNRRELIARKPDNVYLITRKELGRTRLAPFPYPA